MLPPLPTMMQPAPTPGSGEWMRWFRSVQCGKRFDEDKPTFSTDFSLQLAQSLQNFFERHNQKNGKRADRYKRSSAPAQLKKLEPFNPFIIRGEKPEDDQSRVLRDVPPK
jgi:hypothetical protein